MLYWLVRGFFRLFFTLFCRWEVEGLANLPARGALIAVANHVSWWDPIAVGCALPRQVYFMAKKELFDYPVFGFILSKLGAFPVKRGHPDLTAIKRALTLLKDGQILGIFPEGTRSKTGEMLQPYSGAAYFALHAGVPVCPIALMGTRNMGIFRRFKVRIGAPFMFRRSGREDLQTAADLMMERIKELSEFRGSQAGI